MARYAGLFILAILLSPTPGCSGPGAIFCVPACHAAFAACMVGAVGATAGVLTAACIAACTACDLACVGATCLDGSDLVKTANGSTPVAQIKAGDLVATLGMAGEIVYTRIVKNQQVKLTDAPFGFRHIRLANGLSFNVTDEHVMVTESADGVLQIEQALHIRDGDVMVTETGARSSVSFTHAFQSPEKWVLGTVDGTALVNGVLMTTICDDSFQQLPRQYKAAMSKWRREIGRASCRERV